MLAQRYANVSDMLAWMHAQGLQIGANFHDSDGITQVANPVLFASLAETLGYNPTSISSVAFDIGNKTYADALQRVILDPLIQQGLVRH